VTVTIGFDWDEAGGYYAAVGDGSHVIEHGKMTADVPGLVALLDLMHQHADADGTLPYLVMEASRRPIVDALVDHQVTVLACNPNELNVRSKGRNKLKSDRKDAIRLVQTFRIEPQAFRQVPKPSVEARAITLLAREAKDSVFAVHRAAGRARSCLAEFFPNALDAWGPIELATKPEAAAILIAFPTPTVAQAATAEEIRVVVKATGKQSHIQLAVDKALKAFASPRVQYATALEESYGLVLRGLLGELQAAMSHRKALEDRLDVLVPAHPLGKVLLEAPGIGISVASRILGEMGDDPNRFDTKRGLAAFSGMAPVLSQTGKSSGHHTRRQVKGNRLHAALWDMAGSAVQHSPGAIAYYWRKREEGDQHPTAIRKVGRRLSHGLWHVAKNGDAWDDAVMWPDAPATKADAQAYADDVRERLGKERKKAKPVALAPTTAKDTPAPMQERSTTPADDTVAPDGTTPFEDGAVDVVGEPFPDPPSSAPPRSATTSTRRACSPPDRPRTTRAHE